MSGWRALEHIIGKPPASSANFLFGLRIFPFVISTVVTVFLTFPSFWLMERTSLDEDAATFFLALCSAVILGAGLSRVLKAQAKTTRAVTQWSRGAKMLASDARMPKLRASSGAPPLVLVGIRKPTVMVSDTVTSVLSSAELEVAIRHELGHRRSWDNLKKFLISAIPFPGMSSLESAWREAAELAADDAAVTNRQEALDLAAALIKLSRFPQLSPEPAFATGLVSGTSSISLRVERLLEWHAEAWRVPHGRIWTLLILFTIIVSVISNYGATLILTHRLTELLVP
jgi:beta-lactamase regulating signal transducer with metallopeptidase domain